MNSTIDYYDRNTAEFCEDTVNIDMKSHYDIFEAFLVPGAAILDCGCGSGRDSKYFLQKGYSVSALDGSEELCKKAGALTGLNVRHMFFQDIAFQHEFDGIWACASLLHAHKTELPDIFCRLRDSLKRPGVIYASFKYGDFEGERNGRYFTYLTEESLVELFFGIPGISIKQTWVTNDVREGRSSEQWLNIILEA